MRKKNRDLKATKIEIIPMIDTMFFLLVFFILSSVGAIKLQGININLPKSVASLPQQPDPNKKPLELTMTIKPDGAVFVNKIPVPPGRSAKEYLEREVLRQKQKSIEELNNNKGADGQLDPADDVQVIVSADARARYEIMVRCIDEAREAGIYKFAIVPVDEESAPPAGG
jgi:biopolymer transport protein ExbD